MNYSSLNIANPYILTQNMCQCHGWNNNKNIQMTLAKRSVSSKANQKTLLVSFSYLLVSFHKSILLYGLLQQF